MYLNQAIQGLYRENSEDRLSQIFAASFNASRIFRKRVLRFLGCSQMNPLHLRAWTQQTILADSDRGRLDIVIAANNNRPQVIIENKVDAPLLASQLHHYNREGTLARVRKFVLVKHYFQLSVPTPWQVRHWSDLHTYLLKNPATEDGVDEFIIKNFTNYLKEMRMVQVSKIEGNRLRDLAKAMKQIRREQKPMFSLSSANIFITAADFLDVLEQVVNKIREEPILAKRINRRVRFTPWLGYWGKPVEDLWFGFETALSSDLQFGTGILFDTKRGTFTLQSHVSSDEFYSIKHKFRDLNADIYAKQAIQFWKRKLCGKRVSS